ncbi:MAG: fibronectin type III domain-containing protein [candidate division KSB1 bacterium]|nr:fibronectin type III domain-containing protein [candidate division KSB1 bacterium]MDZ7368451.1 fibronectin type III domain-containing protein [candidate division KSB1 bacterium]MDZ7406177.1 fibronectin type III domain-containing protein [candidate division KSB1 bacterium]
MKIIALGILLLSVVSAMADSLTITWEPNTEPDLAGYFVYYGTKDRPHGHRIHVGRQTQYFIQNLKAGETYYVSVTAVDTAHNESVFLEQFAVTIKYTLIPLAKAGPGGHGGPYRFSWVPVIGLDDPTAANPNAAPQTTTTYTVTLTEMATGFSARDSVIVSVPTTGWAVAHIVDADDVGAGLNQSTAPPAKRGTAEQSRPGAFTG